LKYLLYYEPYYLIIKLDKMSVTDNQLAAAEARAKEAEDLAEKAKALAEEADRQDCYAWACGGSHDSKNHPPGGQAPKVVELKVRAAALATAAEKARQAYEQLKAQAS
jgi:hypothetical protein